MTGAASSRRSLLLCLAERRGCRGAVFSTYSFDPRFFEEQVLRHLLGIGADPDENPDQYYADTRNALQRTPVTVICDAGERSGRRCLPYDLLEVARTVFHPKSALLLYADGVRLLLGSGNLTRSGYGGNEELYSCLDLDYADPLLRAFDGHLERLVPFLRRSGTQLKSAREHLHLHLTAATPIRQPQPQVLLDSLHRPILAQFLDLLPPESSIERVGMLAPFYERDETESSAQPGESDPESNAESIFTALRRRCADTVRFDVGASWDNPQLGPAQGPGIAPARGQLWTRSQSDAASGGVHLSLTSADENILTFRDESGDEECMPRKQFDRLRLKSQIWLQVEPRIYAPRHALTKTRARLWLHPARRNVDGNPQTRPLHAKLLLLGFRDAQGKKWTLLLAGSANLSRRALLLKAADGGNIELCLAVRLPGWITLRTLCPELVYARGLLSKLSERSFDKVAPNHALAIESVDYDPRAGRLRVVWCAQRAAALRDWQLRYRENRLDGSADPPHGELVVESFTLSQYSAEIELDVYGSTYSVPILVTDLVALETLADSGPPSLAELLQRLGGSRGARPTRGPVDPAPPDPATDGNSVNASAEGLRASDLFRAWRTLQRNLSESLTAQEFRLHLDGELGARALWEALLRQQAETGLGAEQVWFYGAELLRSLKQVAAVCGRDAARMQAIDETCTALRAQLGGLGVNTSATKLLRRVAAFYGLRGT